jgi:hypothetical protein
MAVTFVFRKKGKRTESGLSASFTLISDAGLKINPSHHPAHSCGLTPAAAAS